jgi:hypothetical protein
MNKTGWCVLEAGVWGVWLALAAGGLLSGCDQGADTPDAAVEDGDGADGDSADAADAQDGADEAQPPPSVCPRCMPDCAGKQCGSDSCGGECGDCLESQQGNACQVNTCVWADVPDCTDKVCGSDGLGGLCGECPTGWVCSAHGRCESVTSDCNGVPETGLCLSGRTVYCQAGVLTHEACKFGACVLDPVSQKATCQDAPCLPRCFGRTCGDDGCGGSCGSCAADQTCQAELGVCVPESGCGDLGEAGACEGHTLVTCQAGAVQTEACLPLGKVCVPAEPGTRAGCCMPQPDEPCGDLPAYGGCAGDTLLTCHDGALELLNCHWSWNASCVRTGMQSHGCGF